MKSNKQQEIYDAVDQLWRYSYLTPTNFKIIRDYTSELESTITTLQFTLKQDYSNEKVSEKLTEAENELEWFKQNVQIYRSTRISVLEMHFTCDRPFHLLETGYTNDPFFDFKKLVEQLNCYYDIREPYKPSNKIAYGWKFAMKKGNPDLKYRNTGARKYLFACIRNYLQENNVEFDVNDIKKIVGLKQCESGDE